MSQNPLSPGLCTDYRRLARLMRRVDPVLRSFLTGFDPLE
jgi:hypothetical protein